MFSLFRLHKSHFVFAAHCRKMEYCGFKNFKTEFQLVHLICYCTGRIRWRRTLHFSCYNIADKGTWRFRVRVRLPIVQTSYSLIGRETSCRTPCAWIAAGKQVVWIFASQHENNVLVASVIYSKVAIQIWPQCNEVEGIVQTVLNVYRHTTCMVMMMMYSFFLNPT